MVLEPTAYDVLNSKFQAIFFKKMNYITTIEGSLVGEKYKSSHEFTSLKITKSLLRNKHHIIYAPQQTRTIDINKMNIQNLDLY